MLEGLFDVVCFVELGDKIGASDVEEAAGGKREYCRYEGLTRTPNDKSDPHTYKRQEC